MDWTMDDLKTLRNATGAGVMACRRALETTRGNIEASKALIAEWGLNEVEKRASRETNEGYVALVSVPGKAAMVALACETDFVARNSLFIDVAESIARSVLISGHIRLSREAEALISDLGMRMKEKVAVSGLAYLEAKNGQILEAYRHGGGRIAAAASAEIVSEKPVSVAGESAARAMLHELCLQITAKAPLFLRKEEIPPADMEGAQKRFAEEVAGDEKLKGKPAAILERALAGKLGRFVRESCLLSQAYIKDESVDVGSWLEAEARKAGFELNPTAFIRLEIAQERSRLK
ncbi:MAG TPA: translation elongation factor Ts [Rectinemataceae bacterium]